MDVFSINLISSITALWFGFGFAIMLGGLFGFVLKTIFDYAVRGMPNLIFFLKK